MDTNYTPKGATRDEALIIEIAYRGAVDAAERLAYEAQTVLDLLEGGDPVAQTNYAALIASEMNGAIVRLSMQIEHVKTRIRNEKKTV